MTQLIVLGLLRKEPLSGYDIQVMLQTSNAESWGGVLVGSIYHALKKLEKDNYIEVASIEQTGHRQKAIYRITNSGEVYFNKLLIQALQVNSVSYPTILYSGLNFIEDFSEKQIISALQKQKSDLKKEKEQLKSGKDKKKKLMGDQLPSLSEVVFEHMTLMIQQQIDFIDKVIQLING